MRFISTFWLLLLILTACEDPIADLPPVETQELPQEPAQELTEQLPEPPSEPETTPKEPALIEPIAVYEDGEYVRDIERAKAKDEGYFVINLGEAWTPYLFSEIDPASGELFPNQYRETFLALAQERFPNDHHGSRAQRDRYLELYGIPPTLEVIRKRFNQAIESECIAALDLSALREFEGHVRYRRNGSGLKSARTFPTLRKEIQSLIERQQVAGAEDLKTDRLSRSEHRSLNRYLNEAPAYQAVSATQKRLKCEGLYAENHNYLKGALDWQTHEALAAFERRHRILGWGMIADETLEALRHSPAELERETLIRVLTERAMQDLALIEDGSVADDHGNPISYMTANGSSKNVPNHYQMIRERLIDSLGLDSTHRAHQFLTELKSIGETRWVAIPAFELPEYYSENMELSVQIDRGDIWYEFPYDSEGKERSQPVNRRPRTTLFVTYLDQTFPIATFGTTIGGWRTEYVDGTTMWKYKNSPVGERVWHKIAAAPVWMPPATTPPRSLLVRTRGGFEPNYHETGPSYASAYGLVAAYHARSEADSDGELRIYGDQGIRSHGSVDYMSIMRRHSHGCHRLHNHIAVRLMNFVLLHREHERLGQKNINYGLDLEHNGNIYRLHLDKGGYEFHLAEPVPVEVLEGRILGDQLSPIEHLIPRYDREAEAYIDTEGNVISVDRFGNIEILEAAEEELEEDLESAALEDIVAGDEADLELEEGDIADAINRVLPPMPESE